MKTNNLINQIQAYLSNGGLFNPELADHLAVRNLLMECREALAQPEQEPVAWIYKGEKSFDGNKYSDEYELTASKQVALWKDKNAKPLYITPPQRTWVGLTDEELNQIEGTHIGRSFARAIEAKLKEKNT
jgi:hypothetical protein